MQTRWQRIRYMPAVPLGEDGRRLTGGKQHIALAREAACEGMVLLKNAESLLPLEKGAAVALFGKAQADYVKGGGGSGDVTVAYARSLAEGMALKEQEGKVRLFAPLCDYYTRYVTDQYAARAGQKRNQPGQIPEPALPPELLMQARAFTNTAVIALCRFSGEGWDRTGTPHDGDFYLSEAEEALVDAVTAAFPRVAVVLNTGGMMDTLWFKDNGSIQAALLAWQGGIEGGLATADILCGDACPSGRLSDTFARDFAAYPSSDTFNESEDYVAYNEDIFVGYRYFETIPGAAEKVCYPFGYGLSYTAFSMQEEASGFDGETFAVTVRVQNVGSRPGKQVVQLYCQAPQGKLGKPSRTLAGYAKTPLLQPGESCSVTIRFTPYTLASYDDEGLVCRYAWVLEKGVYAFLLGENVREARPVSLSWTLKEDLVLDQVTSRCPPRQLDWRLRADGSRAPVENAPALPRPGFDLESFEENPPAENPFNTVFNRAPYALDDVADGKVTPDAFLDTLSTAQMVHLLGGQPNRGVANTFGIGGLDSHGIPSVMTTDGPAGVRIRPQCGVTTTAFPCATLLACTWNEALVERVGQAAALEMKENGLGVWLAPGMNIHRNPLCGRNFEYYSEDPLLTGRTAAAMVRGVQSQGMGACVKHFACNNKEVNRRNSDSRLSERALREIYLKGFEIAVRESQPLTLMTSYNIVNGVRASENFDLITGILRDEWGFRGLVMTDWFTHGRQWAEIAAGNDVKMGKGFPEATLKKVEEGLLDPALIRASAKRVLEMILRLE